MKPKRNPKDKLTDPFLVFQGGGFDGCFWRWEIFDIRSGLCVGDPKANGYNTREFCRIWKESPLEAFRVALRGSKDAIFGRRYNRGDMGMLVRTWGDWLKFCEEFNAGFVRATGMHYQEDVPCGRCKNLSSPEYLLGVDYKGDGGVGIQITKCVCQECYDEICQEDLDETWAGCMIKDRLEMIKEYNERESKEYQVSRFAARRKECPLLAYIMEHQLQAF